LGGSITHCEDFAEIRMVNVQTDEDGRRFVDAEAIRKGKKKYTQENLKRDLYVALEQFIGKGGVGFKTVDTALFGRGKISASPHKDKILNEIKTRLLDEHHISSGSGKALSISEQSKDSVRALMSNNMFTDLLVDLFNSLESKLVK
jgi:hypothetical protein